MWIIVNILTISLWLATLLQQGGNDWAIFTMWVAFLINSIYGWWNWRKLAKKPMTEENLTEVGA